MIDISNVRVWVVVFMCGLIAVFVWIIVAHCENIRLNTHSYVYDIADVESWFIDNECSKFIQSSTGTGSSKRMAVLTIENRQYPYVFMQKMLLKQYCDKYNYLHIWAKNLNCLLSQFPTKNDLCEEIYSENIPVYWAKVFGVLHLLRSKIFDTVMWIDSDAYFVVNAPAVGELFDKLTEKDIFVVNENVETINSGVFAVKNTAIGVEFIKHWALTYFANAHNKWTNSVNKNEWKCKYCLWAGKYYEQGQLNLLLPSYRAKVAVMPWKQMNFNTTSAFVKQIPSTVVVRHLYATNVKTRAKVMASALKEWLEFSKKPQNQ